MHACLNYKQHTLRAYFSTTMEPINKALADLESSASTNIAAVARAHSVGRSTLSRRWNSRTTLKAEALSNGGFLND